MFIHGTASLMTLIQTIYCLATPMLSIGGRRNLALERPTKQSSNYYELSSNDKGRAECAVDGNKQTMHYADDFGCAKTDEDFPSWWMVDLMEDYLVTSIRIVNQFVSFRRLTNFTVEISSQDPSSLQGFPGQTGSPICVKVDRPIPDDTIFSFECTRHVRGRYVRVVKYNEETMDRPLTICEFEVYSISSWRLTDFYQDGSISQSNSLPLGEPSVSEILEIIPKVRSRIQCARMCVTFTGKICRLITFNSLTGMCHLLESLKSRPARRASVTIYRARD